jgi:hypothetical protein
MDAAYQRDRQRGAERFAMTWENIAWEAKHVLGRKDFEIWLASMADILADPFFVPTPVPYEWAAWECAKNAFSHVIGHTWVSPHPEAWHKLGRYQVWRPGCRMEEVCGETEVRRVLLENRLAKL